MSFNTRDDSKIKELMKMYHYYTSITNNAFAKVLDDFMHSLHHEKRFFNENHPIFDHIKKLFDNHTIILSPNELLFRARKFESVEETKSYKENDFYGFNKKDSFVPPKEKTQENRANSKGIPCLYAAKNEETAIAEIRPLIGKDISVATIRPLRDLKLFDLFINPDLPHTEVFNQSPSDIWFGIAFLFSIPYDNILENKYLVTQCISEFIRISGFDGIQYSSSLCEGGKNIALFNCKNEDDGKYDICEPVESKVRTIQGIIHNLGFFN